MEVKKGRKPKPPAGGTFRQVLASHQRSSIYLSNHAADPQQGGEKQPFHHTQHHFFFSVKISNYVPSLCKLSEPKTSHGFESCFLTGCWATSLPLPHGTSLDFPYSGYQVFLGLSNHCRLILHLYDITEFISGPVFINPCLQWIIF